MKRVAWLMVLVLLGAGWLAASPPFVIQALQPMSNVPATAWWLLGIAENGAGGAVDAALTSEAESAECRRSWWRRGPR